MPTQQAVGRWSGDLKGGNGSFKAASGAFEGKFSFGTRFEGAAGTSPEELIAAAHAGCFSMALAHGLSGAGFKPNKVETTAKVHLNKTEKGFAITNIDLICEADVP